MSYILEALKRSQQEREFNQTPTLASVMAAEKEDLPGHTNLWIMVAFLLAFISMAVAIYAITLLKTKDSALPTATTAITVPSHASFTSERSTQLPAPAPTYLKPQLSSEVAVVPTQPAPTLTPQPTPTSNVALSPINAAKSPTASSTIAITVAPLEKSKPRLSATRPQEVLQTPVKLATKSKAPSPKLVKKAELIAEKPKPVAEKTEEPLVPISPTAKPEAVTAPVTVATPSSKATRVSKKLKEVPLTAPAPTVSADNNVVGDSDDAKDDGDVAPVIEHVRKKNVKIPTEVTEAVEEFKQKLRKKTKATGKVANTPIAVPESQPEDAPATTADTLPDAAQAALPANNLTVHVYSKSATRRFVILNSQRLQEGGKTADGLRVESIRPDGLVLEFQGQRYFKHR